ncbi:hypothetical protein [Helicobacter sp. 23-1045]
MRIYRNKVESLSSLRGESIDSPKQSIFCCHTERSEESLFRFCDSAIKSPFFDLDSLSFSQKGLHPRSAPPDYLIVSPKSSRFFAFRGRASLNPLLAKNRRLHYCNLESDFLHHEAGEIKGASHESLLDSAFAESKSTTKDTL